MHGLVQAFVAPSVVRTFEKITANEVGAFTGFQARDTIHLGVDQNERPQHGLFRVVAVPHYLREATVTIGWQRQLTNERRDQVE